MKLKTLHFFFFFLSFTLSFAQSIIGFISDENNQPLEFANVVLYNNVSKEVVGGAISDEKGKYIFNDVATGNYYIEVSTLGFETKKTEAFELTSNKEFNFTLKEESQTLDEIVVKSSRPVIRQTAEKLIVDLEKSEMANSNLQDVMKRVPGVLVTNNGISYAGQRNIRILINGKTTDYMDMDTLLRDMPADNIAKVELVEQPGAEFDAEGSGPIINIILKKNVKLGTHGNVASWIGEDQGFEYGASASIASYKNKLNWQISTGYSSPTWREDLFIKRTVGDETYDQATIEPYNPKSFRTSASIDYYINDNHSVGIGVRRNAADSDRISTSSNNITTQTTSDFLLSENSFNRNQVVFNVNPYYEFKTEAHKFTADFNFVDYSNDNINTISSVSGSTIPYTNQRYLQDGTYQIKTYKADYTRMFSDDLKLSFGSKYSQVETDNDLQSFNENNSGGFDFDAEASNRFLVDENIFALYSKLNLTKGKWSFSGGLRFEDSNTKGLSSSNNETRERKISKIFPSASVSIEINKNISASIAYSYRIRRPNYNTLNSFVTYYDPLSSDVGNENLKPSFTNNYQFNLTYDGQPFFTIGYSETEDAMFQFISQNNDTAEIMRTTINLSDSKNWNFRLFGPLSFIKGVEGYTGFIVNYNKFESATNNLNLQKWSLMWFTQASYELPWKINAEISGNYGTGALEGGIDAKWFAGLDFSFGKKFLDEKLKVNLGFNKILNRGFVGTINYNNLNAEIESNQSRQNIQLRLSYSFGSKFGKKKNRENVSRDEENRIDDNN
ncbi:TonB-dependent receptor [Flaviramulus sp. BrNp1-15]|uniref:outer membrane beta-barrel protein n=1 Tax=Flaviramulus sp. BrNp1-15 TaxID=2916754 RepID=UPI001EE9A364|nr:outer membrane beta-barrel protein [Flaviramulus sp. BrNp1-15]ULC59684.1 TonB-dependent receptor [Flaviramulus sp. BrNp1-15]